MVTKTVIVPDSMPAPEPPPAQASEPPTTTEIPQSVSGPQPGTAEIDPANAQIVTYQQAQENPQMIDPQLHTLQEFINEGDETSPLGVELREDQRKLNSGEVANGLLVVGVQRRSPAALAGLRAVQAHYAQCPRGRRRGGVAVLSTGRVGSARHSSRSTSATPTT